MIPLIFELIRALLGLTIAVLIVYVVISWLYAFDVVSRRNQFVGTVFEFTRRLSDPILNPVRRLIPPIQGIDLSVLVVVLALSVLQSPVSYYIEGLLRGGG